MEYQTFRGADVQEALRAVRKSLGSDALIGSTQQVSNGRQGGFGASYVEIQAAPAASAGPRNDRWPFSADIPDERGGDVRARKAAVRTRRAASNLAARGDKAVASGPRSKTSGVALEEIEKELHTLRAMLEELHATRPAKDRALTYLQQHGIEGKLAKDLSVGASKALARKSTTLRSFLEKKVRDRLKVTTGILERRTPQLITCVGPTGVGKTTSLAKLAARARLDHGRSVAVISLDLFRVGAVEQWQRYAQIMGIPLHVVSDVHGFRKALAQCRAEVVLVDTPGRSGDEDAATRILAQSLGDVTDREVHTLLVLPAWLRASDAERVVACYQEPQLTGVVISKVDETTQIGGALHGALPTDLPVTYLCDGPRVPEDIHEATPDAVIDAVFTEQP